MCWHLNKRPLFQTQTPVKGRLQTSKWAKTRVILDSSASHEVVLLACITDFRRVTTKNTLHITMSPTSISAREVHMTMKQLNKTKSISWPYPTARASYSPSILSLPLQTRAWQSQRAISRHHHLT